MINKNELLQKDERMSLENWEDFWNSVKPQVKSELTVILDKWYRPYREGIQDEAVTEELQRLFEGEKEFVKQIFEKLTYVLSVNPDKEVQALFDVDETLAGRKYEDGDKLHTIFRPTAPLILSKLNSLGIKTGFLTSRGALDEQLQEPNLLQPISQYIDRDLLYSSREYHGGDSLDFEESFRKEFGGPNGIIKESLSDDEIEDARIGMIGNQSKLLMLLDKKDEFKGKATIIVDDFQYTLVCGEQAGLYGVYLPRESQFWVP